MAVAEALTDEGAEVSFIGARGGLEQELIPKAGYELDLAELRGLERSLSAKNLRFLWAMIKGTVDSAFVLSRRRAAVVVGFGGYASWAPIFTAWLLHRRRLIVELDSHMGLANRALSPLADRVALCFDIPGRSGNKYIRSGRPLSQKFLSATAEEGRKAFGLRADMPAVLVTGGSRGAASVNMACVRAFGTGALDFQLLHVSGRRDYPEMRKILVDGGYDRRNYHLLDYTNDLHLALAAADLVVGRSGASVQEIAAMGKPAVLIPYPYATGAHQQKNAEWLKTAGAAVIVPDEQLTAEALRATVNDLLQDRNKLEKMGAAAAGLVRKDGAQRIAAEILTLSGGAKPTKRQS